MLTLDFQSNTTNQMVVFNYIKCTYAIYSPKQNCQWLHLNAGDYTFLSRVHPQSWDLNQKKRTFYIHVIKSTYDVLTWLMRSFISYLYLAVWFCLICVFRVCLTVIHEAYALTSLLQSVSAAQPAASGLLLHGEDGTFLGILHWQVTMTTTNGGLCSETWPQALQCLPRAAFTFPLSLLFKAVLCWIWRVFCFGN